jgi:RNA polymerase-binding transcription factor DksA
MTATHEFDDDAARRRLNDEHDRVQGMIDSLHAEGTGHPAADDAGDTALQSDAGGQGSETFEREKDITILEQLEHDLAEIEAALQRLDDGTYGLDEVTGEPISRERLEAIPTARTDIDPRS